MTFSLALPSLQRKKHTSRLLLGPQKKFLCPKCATGFLEEATHLCGEKLIVLVLVWVRRKRREMKSKKFVTGGTHY